MALDPTLLVGLRVLRPYLDDIVIAGGWVPYLYAAHLPPADEAVALKTRDLDLAVPREVPEREKTIDQLLSDADFACEFRSLGTPVEACQVHHMVYFAYEAAVRPPTSRGEHVMLQTVLEHVESEQAFQDTLENNENVMICCGRMGPMCLPVYDIMEALTPDYPHVAFRDMAFDEPVGRVIRTLPETANFQGLPFTVYFKNGKVVAATSSIQTMDQVTAILDEHFAAEG